MQLTKKLIRVQSGSSIALNFLKKLLFKKLTTGSTTIFLRGADVISVDPQTNGQHDPDLTKLIEQRVQDGYGDFFIDIGANIGLISCQVGNLFQKVICYEPNPLCVNILRVNTAIALNHADVVIHEHGLGGIAGALELWIPKHNWGGAFVRSAENSYTDETLAKKRWPS
ncbi:MAG: FkbM family methyltransferase [Gammaproteobacteria bacterium]|nr:FkbM family methyltransferase [Gammaproteobacteria bacterium]